MQSASLPFGSHKPSSTSSLHSRSPNAAPSFSLSSSGPSRWPPPTTFLYRRRHSQVAFLSTEQIFLLSARGARNIARLTYPHRPSFTEAAEALLSAYLLPLDLPRCTASTWKYGGRGNKLFGGFLHQAISPVFGVWLAWSSGCRFLPRLLVCQ